MEDFIWDTSGKSAALKSVMGHGYLSAGAIVTLLENSKAFGAQQNVRICLHGGHEDPLQLMVLLEWSHSPNPPHRHRAPKSETFFLIKGRMDVQLFGLDSLALDNAHPSLYRMSAGDLLRLPDHVGHQIRALDPYAIYLEIKLGPFTGPDDSELIA